MKKNILFLFVIVLMSSCHNSPDPVEGKTKNTKEVSKQLRHIVLFTFKEAATPGDIQKVEFAFVALPSKIKEIKDLEWGINNSPEGLNKGFTHCFFVTFDSEKDRSIYLPHPAHMAFLDVLDPYLEDVLVLDYWTN